MLVAEEELGRGAFEHLAAAVAERHSTLRVVPAAVKRRARARHPWEARVADLAEVLQWKTDLAWREEAVVHVNSLETRSRLNLGRRLSRRPASHHRHVQPLSWKSTILPSEGPPLTTP